MKKLPQDKGWKDYTHGATKAGLSVVPFVGGALATLYETVFSSPIDKRKEAWLIELESVVAEINEQMKELTPEKLSQHELFISAYLQASNIAVRTHHAEKLKVLSNAVKNSVLKIDIDESKKLIFINLIDGMTPMHFKVLHFLVKPEEYIERLNTKTNINTSNFNSVKHYGSLTNVWNEMYPKIRAQSPLIDLVITDLNRSGLIRIARFHDAGGTNSVGTGIGKEFVDFTELKSEQSD